MLDISAKLARLRIAGGDNTSIEVKSAAGGLPESLTSSLSALANLPGGGTVILGLDEAAGFAPVHLQDVQVLKQGLGTKARTYTPPVNLTIHDATVGGMPIVVADVAECPVAQKPCVVTATGKAYVRSYDGDFELSELERQAFIVGRTHPDFDLQPVPASNAADLDPDLITDWLATVRERNPAGLGRFSDDAELLRRGGVVTAAGELTVAGLLSLGSHPQQWFPRFVIQLASMPSGSPGLRAVAPLTLDGPIPVMLAGAMEWARKVFASTLVTGDDGNLRDDREYPLDAFRELISNALVHRELAEWSRGFAIDVRHLPDRLVITNPGGLFGITVDRLGAAGVTSARNGGLLTICQYVRARGGDVRVVEALATGIPTVTAALARSGLPPAKYLDQGIRFTVILERKTKSPPKKVLVNGRSSRAVLAALTDEPQTVAQVQAVTGLSDRNVRRILRTLRDRNVAVAETRTDALLTYRRAPE